MHGAETESEQETHERNTKAHSRRSYATFSACTCLVVVPKLHPQYPSRNLTRVFCDGTATANTGLLTHLPAQAVLSPDCPIPPPLPQQQRSRNPKSIAIAGLRRLPSLTQYTILISYAVCPLSLYLEKFSASSRHYFNPCFSTISIFYICDVSLGATAYQTFEFILHRILSKSHYQTCLVLRNASKL